MEVGSVRRIDCTFSVADASTAENSYDGGGLRMPFEEWLLNEPPNERNPYEDGQRTLGLSVATHCSITTN